MVVLTRAEARMRRGRRAGTVAALGIFALVVLFAAVISDPGSWSRADAAVVLIPAVAGTVLLVLGFRWLGGRFTEPHLLLAASRQDQRAVQRALRTGRAPDARLHTLASDAARHNLRHPWLPWLYATLGATQAGLAVLRITDGGGWRHLLPAVLAVIMWCVLTGRLLRHRSRSRRYLGDAVPPTGALKR